MLRIDVSHMISGRKYYIKTILADTISYSAILLFKQYYIQREWDHSLQQSNVIQYADFVFPASTKGSAFDWGVRVENIKECYAIAGSSKEQRNIQLGLLGSLPNGKSIPYDVGRLIASYL